MTTRSSKDLRSFKGSLLSLSLFLIPLHLTVLRENDQKLKTFAFVLLRDNIVTRSDSSLVRRTLYHSQSTSRARSAQTLCSLIGKTVTCLPVLAKGGIKFSSFSDAKFPIIG